MKCSLMITYASRRLLGAQPPSLHPAHRKHVVSCASDPAATAAGLSVAAAAAAGTHALDGYAASGVDTHRGASLILHVAGPELFPTGQKGKTRRGLRPRHGTSSVPVLIAA